MKRLKKKSPGKRIAELEEQIELLRKNTEREIANLYVSVTDLELQIKRLVAVTEKIVRWIKKPQPDVLKVDSLDPL